ncbi:hypothetical protein MMC25_004240 [Agyrium rufum]|nr:hypothetical protein [Agyrium rufum]
MSRKRKHATQDNTWDWDDSALIRSWDEALEEYKLYHSIHARGERIEDVLQAHADGAKAEPTQFHSHPTADEDMEDGEVYPKSKQTGPNFEVNGRRDAQQEVIQDERLQSSQPEQQTRLASDHLSQTKETIPSSLARNSTQDDSMKNLMMSWYWAGYYTGLHEGSTQ